LGSRKHLLTADTPLSSFLEELVATKDLMLSFSKIAESCDLNRGCQMAYFQTKIPIWVNVGGSWNGSCQYPYFIAFGSILRPFCIFWGHLLYFMFLVYSFPFWYVVPRKIWQPWFELSWNGGATYVTMSKSILQKVKNWKCRNWKIENVEIEKLKM
jgi:hypothetical protein